MIFCIIDKRFFINYIDIIYLSHKMNYLFLNIQKLFSILIQKSFSKSYTKNYQK
jgi:hypothetical protein